jgi:hypothetical protein
MCDNSAALNPPAMAVPRSTRSNAINNNTEGKTNA